MTERELQTAVIECAQLLGWHVAHFRPAQTANGWRTPVEANAAGFPDLTLIRDRILFAELKSDRGVLSVAQEVWIDAIDRAGVEAHVWRPDDWTSGRIETHLRRRAA